MDLAAQGLVMDLGAYLDAEQLKVDQSPYLVRLGTVGSDGSWPSEDGVLHGAFVKVDVKSLIWYPVPELRAGGYAIPETWSQLIDLSDRLVADGHTPWCMGWGSGDASGWPGTDWVENLLLAGAGPEVYDRWTYHEIPFDSPPVREAFDRLGRILFTDGYLARPAHSIHSTIAQYPMVEETPPGCWLYQFASFGGENLPRESVESETNVFPFPVLSRDSPPRSLAARTWSPRSQTGPRSGNWFGSSSLRNSVPGGRDGGTGSCLPTKGSTWRTISPSGGARRRC